MEWGRVALLIILAGLPSTPRARRIFRRTGEVDAVCAFAENGSVELDDEERCRNGKAISDEYYHYGALMEICLSRILFCPVGSSIDCWVKFACAKSWLETQSFCSGAPAQASFLPCFNRSLSSTARKRRLRSK